MRFAQIQQGAAVPESAAADNVHSGAVIEDSIDDDALDALYVGLVKSYYDPIVRYIYGMVSNTEQAEDLAQETFLKAYRALPDVGPPENPRAWLYRIATNASLDFLRHRNRFGMVALDKLSNVLRGESRHGSVEDAAPIDQALNAIKEDHRSILLLFAESGLQAPEVAEVLGISPAAARKRRQRAREAFTAAYQEVTDEV